MLVPFEICGSSAEEQSPKKQVVEAHDIEMMKSTVNPQFFYKYLRFVLWQRGKCECRHVLDHSLHFKLHSIAQCARDEAPISLCFTAEQISAERKHQLILSKAILFCPTL